MTKFLLNNQTIETDLPVGTTVLDFVRYHKNLKGTKIGCREGDCGACTVLVGELRDDAVRYRTMTSCLMPIANAAGKHIVTIEGINHEEGTLTQVQQALVDESGTQCGFCTVGFVVSMTGFAIGDEPRSVDAAVSAVDGNICRCTGYKSIERACERISNISPEGATPDYFKDIAGRLKQLTHTAKQICNSGEASGIQYVGGGTDLYVQKHDEMTGAETATLFDREDLNFIRETGTHIEIGASVVVTDLLESEIFNRAFPNLRKHLKLVSSTPIRNMATIGGNLVNASPIGDMTVWLLALDAEIDLSSRTDSDDPAKRTIRLKDFYLGYKKLAKSESEIITGIRFAKNFSNFNFEKVCKRTYLDIASVNSAISFKNISANADMYLVSDVSVAVGGVAPVPLYLKETSKFLCDREITPETIDAACQILQQEIAPISDVRGSAEYKRLLAGQLFRAHFIELFKISD
jgi:xanthine dehydrogenase small subunit